MLEMHNVKAALMGLAVGDALGVPVEFSSRNKMKKNPVTGMRGNGTWDQPIGTWSDDTSLTIAAMDSITRLKKIDKVDETNKSAIDEVKADISSARWQVIILVISVVAMVAAIVSALK